MEINSNTNVCQLSYVRIYTEKRVGPGLQNLLAGYANAKPNYPAPGRLVFGEEKVSLTAMLFRKNSYTSINGSFSIILLLL